MFKKLLFILICIFSFSSSNAQRNHWNSVEFESINISQDDVIDYDIDVKKANYFQLDNGSLNSQLSSAPYRAASSSSDVIISIPNHEGVMEFYEVFRVRTLSPQLATNHPEIQSFVGKSVNPRDASILRITITPQGFYAMILKPNSGQHFINPYDKNGQYYMSFLKSSAIDKNKPNCLFTNDDVLGKPAGEDSFIETLNVDDSNLRTYRLAMACTGEYAQFHINQAGLGGGTTNQQITAVLSAMTVTVDRVNSVYERDLGLTLQLVADNDQIIFLDGSTDPYTNNNVGAMLGENQSTLDSTILSSNYDIGHIVSTAPSGGVALLGSVCVNGAKAQGATGGLSPVGDPFDIDFVAHEMGHQFGANHTQNNNCARNPATAVEPGSANTIMGYAGICPPNVQNNSDAHFHQVSIDEMYTNISSSSGSSCGIFTGQTNTAPSLTPVPDYTIPNGTAFFLDVTATDAENDALTYNWEQINNSVSPQPPLQTSTVGPNFRSLPSKTASKRYFPDFNEVLNNNLAPTWEVVPTVARSMNFVVTVRDNNILVGQSSRDITTVNFASVGPFEVTSQNATGINWLPGETRTITWNVAGTTGNGINTSNVNILLSTDGGQNFNTVLVSNTANDGTEDITVPSVQAPFCRILVEPVDNVYYALNSEEFSIDTEVNTSCDDFANTSVVAIPDGLGPDQQGPAATSVINIPNNITNIDDINITLDVSHTYINDLVFQLANPNGDFITLWNRNCNSEDGFNIVFNDNGSTLPSPNTNCANPLTGSFAPADTSSDLATLFGSGTQGDWTLAFADFFNNDTGTLNSWEIEICTTTFSVEDNALNNFTISPNPNDGIFNITFGNPLSRDSKISIYDMQGRLVERLTVESSSTNQRVVLENQYQSGVYLIEISNEEGKSIDKLIIR